MESTRNLPIQDRDMLQDAIGSQKEVAALYNRCANECAGTALRNEMLNILNEEHTIQADLFMEMQKRGWMPTPMAEQKAMDSAKQALESQPTQG